MTNTSSQHLAFGLNGLVAADVLLRQEPDDDDEDEDRSHDEDEDDDYQNDDCYSERPSGQLIDGIAPGPRRLWWEAKDYLFSSTAKLNCLPNSGATLAGNEWPTINWEAGQNPVSQWSSIIRPLCHHRVHDLANGRRSSC